jgi:hypothetical protein
VAVSTWQTLETVFVGVLKPEQTSALRALPAVVVNEVMIDGFYSRGVNAWEHSTGGVSRFCNQIWNRITGQVGSGEHKAA